MDKHLEDFFSIPQVIPNSKSTYDIYIYSIESWTGLLSL